MTPTVEHNSKIRDPSVMKKKNVKADQKTSKMSRISAKDEYFTS